MLNIKKQLHTDILAYCKANEIDDVDKFCSDLLEKAFITEKYGATPQITGNKNVEKKNDHRTFTNIPHAYNYSKLSLMNIVKKSNYKIIRCDCIKSPMKYQGMINKIYNK